MRLERKIIFIFSFKTFILYPYFGDFFYSLVFFKGNVSLMCCCMITET